MEEQTPDTEQTQKAPKKTPQKGSAAPKKALTAGAGILALAAIGFALWTTGAITSIIPGLGSDVSNEGEGQENRAQGGPVATVNGDEISRQAYEDRLSQANARYQQDGLDLSAEGVSAQIQDQVVNDLINELLLVQAAAEAGVSPTQEQIDAQYSQLTQQYGSEQELNSALDAQGVSGEQVQGEIARQLAIEQYLSSQIDTESVTVTDEEAQTAYSQVAETQDNAPPYEEVADSVKQQLQQQKLNQLVVAFIESLREQSDIQVLL